ncbi:hypothetical protein [Thiomicrospira cyclica]|uniref:Uncharacterized protein n=1 Tax=Thiomicrospira cyclica (strain DSM 14477 / JCM 11371 / ALM1) TaxID=717773 RepID=F6DBT4_THICA|nr:hypothetical protein [Thiomicrospira cyclica]AEG31320.1 hypothetical protein Thicy_0547 [Thiomicrospira cyclica ALM1]
MKNKIYIFMLLCIVVPNTVYADIQFVDLYKPDSSFNLVAALLVGAIFAAAAAALIFYTGGTVSPIVAGIGAKIGAMMGLNGAAAANAGLAFLGGGSIASGGFGIVGGVAVLSAAFVFSTEVVFDYTYSKVSDSYSYSSFQKASQDMINFPIPVNRSGSNLYEQIITDLDSIKDERGVVDISSSLFKYSIERLEVKENHVGLDDKEMTLLAKLYFINNDYIRALDFTRKYRSINENNEVVNSIYSISSLYDGGLEMEETVSFFVNNFKIIEDGFKPLVLSIFLDRIFYRIISESLSYKYFLDIYAIVYDKDVSKDKALYTEALNSRSLMYIKLQQQKILSIYLTKNLDVWSNQELPDYLSYTLDEFLLTSTFLNDYVFVLKEEVYESIESKFVIRRASSWQKDWLDSLEISDKLSSEYVQQYEVLREYVYEVYSYQDGHL